MSAQELQLYVSIVKDCLLAVAALTTSLVAIYGVATWRREHTWNEKFSAARGVVLASHKLTRVISHIRRPVWFGERMTLTRDVVANTTTNEQWRISESSIFQKRIEELEVALDGFSKALIEARVVFGSSVLKAYLPLQEAISELVTAISQHVVLIRDYRQQIFPESPEIAVGMSVIIASENGDDDLSQKISRCREEGEKFLLPYLDRGSIHG
jgi:hypothetical protein